MFAHRVTKYVIQLVLSCSTNYGLLYQRIRVTTRWACTIFGDEHVHEVALDLD